MVKVRWLRIGNCHFPKISLLLWSPCISDQCGLFNLSNRPGLIVG